MHCLKDYKEKVSWEWDTSTRQLLATCRRCCLCMMCCWKLLTCLNPRDQKSVHGLQNCKKVVNKMPSIMAEDQITVGDEWLRYQEMELMNEDMEVRVDHFWNKYSGELMRVETNL